MPLAFPDIITLRQLFHCRGQDTGHTQVQLAADTIYFYTDGSADTPLQPETRRAAWSVIQCQPESTTAPYVTIKIQHVEGHQSIARAELAAVVWIVHHAADHHWSQHVTITTDSQYVIDSIAQVTRPNQSPTWYRLANADLLQILTRHWNAHQFSIRKVRSHQKLEDIPPGPLRQDAVGNAWADHAAVRARQTDHPVVVDLDLNLEHAKLKQKDQADTSIPASQDHQGIAFSLPFILPSLKHACGATNMQIWSFDFVPPLNGQRLMYPTPT